MSADQIDIFAVLTEGECYYPGCEQRATHGARAHIPATYGDQYGPDDPNPRAGDYGVDCCLRHANYYADAWAYGPVKLYPAMRDSVWIEILAVAA